MEMIKEVEEKETINPINNENREMLHQSYIYSPEQINEMTDEEVEKNLIKFNKKLSSDFSKDLHITLCKAYSAGISKVCPTGYNINEFKLSEDLESDSFIKKWSSNLGPIIYYKYGNYVAPILMFVKTLMHVEKNPVEITDPVE
jgi:hypothetical protein